MELVVACALLAGILIGVGYAWHQHSASTTARVTAAALIVVGVGLMVLAILGLIDLAVIWGPTLGPPSR